jgi:hypothetical protein
MRKYRTPFSTSQSVTATSLADAGAARVLDSDAYRYMLLEVINGGSAALTDFSLMVKAHENSAEYLNLVTGSAWNSPGVAVPLEWMTARIDTLASGGKAMALIRIPGIYAFKFQAKVASGTAAITIKGTLI